MKLERLSLENFRQYYGRQRVEFSKDSKRHVTVVHGVNGAGKTSMFIALNWCLYGREVAENIGDLISKEAMHQTEPGELVQASVELAFSHDEQKYILRRSLAAVRQVDGTIEPYQTEEVIMKRITASGEAKDEKAPNTVINAILPANVRTYFLFDGEKIENFARPEAASEVKDAIYLVLRLEILDRARKHLKDLEGRYRKELVLTSGDAKLNELEQQVKQEEALQKQAETRQVEVQKEIDLARQRVAEIDQQLRGMTNVSQLQREREQIEAGGKAARQEQDKLIEDIQAKATAAYMVVAQPIVARALAVLNEKRAKGQIPSNVRQQFVQDLLQQLVCICGRPFTEHGTEHQNLLTLLEKSVPSSLENEVLDTNNHLLVFQANGDSKANEIKGLMQQRVSVKERIQVLEARSSELHLQLKGSPLEDVSQLEKKRQSFQADIESYMLECGSLAERIAKAGKQIEKLTKEITQARKSSDKAKHLSRKLELAQQGAKAIEEKYQVTADGMRLQIEAKTNEIFKALVWKDSHFQRVGLGPDYNLEVIDRYGTAARPELSAGERQVLSLSFITAMAHVSEEHAPLVMDTPFGRLSSHHRNSITANLPSLTSQLILFVTDEELRDEARQNLQPYIGAEYRLNFDDATSCTVVEEY